MKLGGLSFDIDSVASHLEGYGFPRPTDDGTAYTVAIPRILKLLARTGARGTFFLIAGEAREHPRTVAEIAAAGHEIASHSMTHALPFRGLDPQVRRTELTGSRRLLESLAGTPVRGFRAPSWDLDRDLPDALVAAGYRYDASTYPSILLPLLRIAIARRGAVEGSRRVGRRAWSAFWGPSKIHVRATARGPLTEVPMCTTPWLRLPYYHTVRLLAPGPVFRSIRRLAHARRGPVWYQFHAVDFLSLQADRLDPRIGRHPGMEIAVERKLDMAAEALRALGSGRSVVPLAELVDDFGAGEWRAGGEREENR